MHGDVMNAMAHLSGRVRNVLRVQPLIDWFPRRAAVVTAKRTRRRDGNKDSLLIPRVQQNTVQAHAAGARLPLRSRAVAAQTRKFLPGLTAVVRAKQGGIFN